MYVERTCPAPSLPEEVFDDVYQSMQELLEETPALRNEYKESLDEIVDKMDQCGEVSTAYSKVDPHLQGDK